MIGYGQKIPNFTRAELACPCCGVEDMSLDFMRHLQALRTEWRRPLTITSGYRCPDHNKAVGGAKNSRHLEGIAVDIDWRKWNVQTRQDFLRMAINFPFYGIGIAKTFIHVDRRVRQWRAVWTY